VLLNSDVCSRYPQIIQAGSERGWAWLAHGRDNSTFQAGHDARRGARIPDRYRREDRGCHRPQTPRLARAGPNQLLAELGLTYTLDWTKDDQPYELAVPERYSVSYSIELNDVTLFVTKSYTGCAVPRGGPLPT
jgi:hypothetical protein